MGYKPRPFAIVTAASSGIGLELAKHCAKLSFELLLVSADPGVVDLAATLSAAGAVVKAVQADLETLDGVEKLYAAASGRKVDALFLNASHGFGGAFLDQPFTDVRRILDTQVTGTLYLLHKFVRDMRARGKGRVLITGELEAPGSAAVGHGGIRTLFDAVAFSLRSELQGSGVSVTCVVPAKALAIDAARNGFDAMMHADVGLIDSWREVPVAPPPAAPSAARR